MSDAAASPESAAKKRPDLNSIDEVVRTLVGKVVTMVNPESLEGAPLGFRITTGFYKAKILAISSSMLTVATEFSQRGQQDDKEPVKQFIPVHRIKRVSVMRGETLVHV